MKGTYMAPQMQVAAVNTESMIALSGEDNTLRGTVSNTEVTSGYADTKSNHYNVWDDDWR